MRYGDYYWTLCKDYQRDPFSHSLPFFWLALRTLTFGGSHMNYNKVAKSLTFGRGSEVSQDSLLSTRQFFWATGTLNPKPCGNQQEHS